MAKLGPNGTSGYVGEDDILKHYDVNDLSSARPVKSEDFSLNEDDLVEADSKPAAPTAGLSAMYNSKSRARPQFTRTSPVPNTRVASSFGGLDNRKTASKAVKREPPINRRPQPGRRSDAGTTQAKKFFEKAQKALQKDEISKVSKLLVSMKTFGNKKDEGQYVKAAKELITTIVGSQVDSRRIELVSTLFPLLPVKHRYRIQKLASVLAFEKSLLRSKCKEVLSEKEVESVQIFVLSTIFNSNSSHDAIALDDRALLQDSQKILAILLKNSINLQHFFDLLPDRQLRRVKTLALEMKKQQGVAAAKERSASLQGERCVNTVLFRPREQKKFAPSVSQSSQNTETEDAESQQNLTNALSQAFNVNRQKKDRVMDFQKKSDMKVKPKPFNPYHQALKDSAKRNLPVADRTSETSKRVRNNTNTTNTSAAGGMDMIEQCLEQVKSDGYVQPKTKLERINGNIKANVPKGMVCVVCNEKPKQVRARNKLIDPNFSLLPLRDCP